MPLKENTSESIKELINRSLVFDKKLKYINKVNYLSAGFFKFIFGAPCLLYVGYQSFYGCFHTYGRSMNNVFGDMMDLFKNPKYTLRPQFDIKDRSEILFTEEELNDKDKLNINIWS